MKMNGRIVCFVCGSAGAEATIRIKPHDRAPYFPFLEHHDPPKGARVPGGDGMVDSCRVCYAFLTQQWEAYERSKTPAIKRLYWLKRADNGHFTGAEMRLQGEYIAQIMGLQYQPGSLDGRNSPDTNTRDGLSPVQYRKEDRDSVNFTPHSYSSSIDNKESLNTPDTKSLVKAKLQTQAANTSSVLIEKPRQRETISEGVLDLTMKKDGDPRKETMPKDPATVVCYVCGKNSDVNSCRFVNSCRQPTNEPFFPVIQKLPCSAGAFPVNTLGQAIVCSDCRSSLYQQWQAYEMSGIPLQHRVYRLYDEKVQGIKREYNSQSGQGQTVMKSMAESPENEHCVCYLCGKLYTIDLIRMLYTLPPRDPNLGTLYFPFVRDLRRPPRAEPLKSDGSVLSCRNCYAELYQQWQVQEAQMIPVYQRKYSLSFNNAASPTENKNERPSSPEYRESIDNSLSKQQHLSSSNDVSRPLNIQISDVSVTGGSNSGSSQSNQSSQGLLAIATNPDKTLYSAPSSPSKLSSLLRKQPEGQQSKPTVPHPLEKAVSLPKKVCFLCGEKCLTVKVHVLYSYPARHEAKAFNSQVIPFFPFLANCDPAPGAEPMTDEGTVVSCNVCFHILLKQWNEHEVSKNPAESNRWLRNYSVAEFVCYVCAKVVLRKHVRILELTKFPFLKDHKYPSDALLLDGGCTVAVCKSCAFSLNTQFAENERLKVPMALRRYNWLQSGMSEEHNDDSVYDEDVQGEDGQKLCMNIDEDSNESSNSDVASNRMSDTRDTSGLPQGTKPPPLTMISPAASKLPRNTATVTPLNQVSPSNGVNSAGANAALNATRTSSFAAALRKLAHQAKDPEEGAPSGGHSSQPGSSNTSPRAPTPKRGPPPLVYNSHSSSLTSPPVVTIAPTHAHSSLVNSDLKQSLERAHSVQSSSSSVYEPHGLKQERDRPQSTQSNREDDRGSVKDMSLSRSRLTPHSVRSSTSPATSREEMGRGFQPYRSGEDMRHQLPPASFGLDPATAAAYSYPPFLPPHAFPHPAFRFDDPLLLERYRMMQPQYLPFGHPGMLPPPAVHPLLGAGRYPAELLHQQFPFMSQTARLPDHLSPALSERQRLEEEKIRELEREKEREREREREREKEREAILQREKERAREREREYDKERAREQYYIHQQNLEKSREYIERDGQKERSTSLQGSESGRLPRVEEHAASRYGSITHGTPKDQHHLKDSKYNGKTSLYENSIRSNREGGHHGEKSTIHLPSNVPEQNYSKEEKHAHLLNSSPEKVHNDLLMERKYAHHHSKEQEIPRNHSHSSVSSQPMSQSDHKFSKSSDSSFFRPFDTNLLTNGYHGSHVSHSDKYSSSYKSVSDKNRHDAIKSQSGKDSMDFRNSQKGSAQESQIKQENYLSQRRMSFEDMKNSKCSTPQFSSSMPSVNQTKHCDQVSSKHHLMDHKKSSQSSSKHNTSHVNLHHQKSLSSSSVVFPHKTISSESNKLVVSRLDIEEQKLRERRAKDEYYSDSEEEEQAELAHKERLLLITSGPPLTLDTNETKMSFFRELGLTSQRIKRELEFQKQRKRRRLHKERSVSPVDVEEEEDANTPSSLHVPKLKSSDDLCQEKDFPEKCSFLGSFKLGTVELGRKRELEKIRITCEEERIRRLSEESSQGHGCKRKRDETDEKESSSHESHKGKKLSMSDYIHSSDGNHRTKNLLFSDCKARKLGRDFVQEFHDSVLQTTRQKERNLNCDHKVGVDGATAGSSCFINDSNDAILLHDTEKRQIKWPGIEAIIGSYQRHVSDQSMERQVLGERCRSIRAQNKELKRTAEHLSRKMAELLEGKRRADETKSQIQSSIDCLKSSLKELR